MKPAYMAAGLVLGLCQAAWGQIAIPTPPNIGNGARDTRGTVDRSIPGQPSLPSIQIPEGLLGGMKPQGSIVPLPVSNRCVTPAGFCTLNAILPTGSPCHCLDGNQAVNGSIR